MFDPRLEEELRRCPGGTREALIAFREHNRAEDLETFARGILVRNLDDAYHSVLESGGEDLRIVEDLGIDSLTMAEIAMNFEDALDIQLIDEELKRLKTLGDIKRHILERRAAAQSPTLAS